jgi:hypothetical protein
MFPSILGSGASKSENELQGVGINYEPKWQRYLTPMEIT